MVQFFFDRAENIIRKGENAGNQHTSILSFSKNLSKGRLHKAELGQNILVYVNFLHVKGL